MNRADFLNLIESRSPVDRQMLGEVIELVNIFPYFQSAHLLLLKGLRDNKDVKYDSQLKNSAIYIANRELLYYYLSNEPVAVIPALEPIAIHEEGKGENETHFSVVDVAINNDIFIVEPGNDEAITTSTDDDLLELISDDELTDDIKNSRKQLQSDLIDKFIVANPRIQPVREKSDMPVEDLSKASTEENGVFVTDTLAQIYIHQGYYSKAIDIYEKLSLKFPEKSTYFATQIEKVREYLKK